jgi:branched-chain amino acid transport system substrate-binding protein
MSPVRIPRMPAVHPSSRVHGRPANSPETFPQIFATVVVAINLFATSYASAETLTIGVIAPLTGGGAAWGMAAAEGPKILADDINARGGLDVAGKLYHVEVVAYDDQYKAANAIAAYKRLTVADGVKYMIIMGSAGALALQRTVDDDQVIALTASYSPKAIGPDHPYMFRLFSTTAEYLPAFAAWMKHHVKGNRIVVVNPNDESGWSQNDGSNRIYKQCGFDVVSLEVFERSQQNFQPMITKIIALRPDLVDLSSTPPATAGLFIRQARELGYQGQFVKTGGAGPKEIVAAAGKAAAEGSINMLYADPANKEYQRVATAYTRKFGQAPNEIIISFYDAANAMLRAIQKAGTVDDTAKVVAAFPSVFPMHSLQGDLLTLGGKSTYGINRQIMTVNYIGVVRNGAPEIITKAE